MNRYRWCGLTVASRFLLPELPTTDDATSDPAWTVTARPGRAIDRPDGDWFHEWHLTDNRPWAAFARTPRGYLVRFVEIGDYEIDVVARTIVCWDPGEAPSHTIRHMLLDQVLPLLAGGEHRLAIHGSVIDTPRGAIVVLADTGHGKSSLAARFAQRGYTVLSDDCCVIEDRNGEFLVVPSYPGLRLRPDSIVEALATGPDGAEPVAHYSTKLRMTIAKGVKFHSTPVHLSNIYVVSPLAELKQAQEISITGQAPRRSLLDLINFTFHIDVKDHARIRSAFQLAGDVAERYPTRLLSFPWDWKRIDEVVDALLEDR